MCKRLCAGGRGVADSVAESVSARAANTARTHSRGAAVMLGVNDLPFTDCHQNSLAVLYHIIGQMAG